MATYVFSTPAPAQTGAELEPTAPPIRRRSRRATPTLPAKPAWAYAKRKPSAWAKQSNSTSSTISARRNLKDVS